MAVSITWGSLNKGFRAPSKGFGADGRQVESGSWQELYGCFYKLGVLLVRALTMTIVINNNNNNDHSNNAKNKKKSPTI